MHNSGSLYELLDTASQVCIDEIVSRYRCTVQESRELCEAARDLSMWGENGIAVWWESEELRVSLQPNSRERKKRLIAGLRDHLKQFLRQPTRYDRPSESPKRDPIQFDETAPETSVFGECPVRSERTLCCNLKTIDAVQNCSFGCSISGLANPPTHWYGGIAKAYSMSFVNSRLNILMCY